MSSKKTPEQISDSIVGIVNEKTKELDNKVNDLTREINQLKIRKVLKENKT